MKVSDFGGVGRVSKKRKRMNRGSSFVRVLECFLRTGARSAVGVFFSP